VCFSLSLTSDAPIAVRCRRRLPELLLPFQLQRMSMSHCLAAGQQSRHLPSRSLPRKLQAERIASGLRGPSTTRIYAAGLQIESWIAASICRFCRASTPQTCQRHYCSFTLSISPRCTRTVAPTGKTYSLAYSKLKYPPRSLQFVIVWDMRCGAVADTSDRGVVHPPAPSQEVLSLTTDHRCHDKLFSDMKCALAFLVSAKAQLSDTPSWGPSTRHKSRPIKDRILH